MSRRDALDLVLTVVDHGGFSAAGRVLGLTPSAVGKRIAQLEARLGVTLLHRSTRRLSLTSAGQHYVEEGREIATRLASLEEDVANGSASLRGSIRLTAPIAFGRLHVAPTVIAFMQQHQEIEVELMMTDRSVDLVGEGLDLAVRTGTPRDSSLIARRLMRYDRAVCATPGYLAAHGVPAIPSDLAAHRCLKLAHETRPADWALEGGPVSAQRLGRGLRCNSLEALQMACLAGEGLACLPDFLCRKDVKAGRLASVLEQHTAGHAVGDVSILRPEAAVLPRRVRALIEFLADQLTHQPFAHERD